MKSSSTPLRALRLVRALAMVGVAGSLGCGASTTATDASAGDSATADSPAGDTAVADAAFSCSSCNCAGFVPEAGVVTCESMGHAECCAAVGPLPPPELPERA